MTKKKAPGPQPTAPRAQNDPHVPQRDAARSADLETRFYAGVNRFYPMDASLEGDREALYDALREAGVAAFLWPWVRLVIGMWRRAVSCPACSLAERRAARKRLAGIGGALASRGSGRIEDAATVNHRAFVVRYLPILRDHLKLLGRDHDLDLGSLTDVSRWRYLKLREAGFRARDLNRRVPGDNGRAYAIIARTLGYDERYVRKLVGRARPSR